MNAPSEQSLLFGHDTSPGLVALEHVPGTASDSMRLFFRRDGKLTTEDEPFAPFLWLQEAGLLAGSDVHADFVELSGKNALKFIARFNGWNDFESAVRFLKKNTGRNPS